MVNFKIDLSYTYGLETCTIKSFCEARLIMSHPHFDMSFIAVGCNERNSCAIDVSLSYRPFNMT